MLSEELNKPGKQCFFRFVNNLCDSQATHTHNHEQTYMVCVLPLKSAGFSIQLMTKACSAVCTCLLCQVSPGYSMYHHPIIISMSCGPCARYPQDEEDAPRKPKQKKKKGSEFFDEIADVDDDSDEDEIEVSPVGIAIHIRFRTQRKLLCRLAPKPFPHSCQPER